MPFPSTFDNHHFIERARRIRANPLAAYGLAVGAVLLATALRALVDPLLTGGPPFITYYPAIILAALLGGLGPGVASLVLSSLLAWYFFLPPFGSWELEWDGLFTLTFFIAVSSINIGLIMAMSKAMELAVAREGNTKVLLESAPAGIVVVDAEGRITLVNAATEKLFGYPRAELLGKNVEVLVPEGRAGVHKAAREAFLRKPEARAVGAGRDLSGRRRDGSEFPVEIGLNPLSRDGRHAVLATVVDISARKRVQENQRLLIGELRHRTQNLFAVVQAIANQTLFKGRPPAEAKLVFNERLLALSRAYTAVADAAWEGASLAEILGRQFIGFDKRVSVSGCDIVVGVSAAQQFAMIVHELTTNAIKYGALSAPEGRVSVDGRIDRRGDDDILLFVWRESGGPPVSPPSRKGFGSMILLDAAREAGGQVNVSYHPGGLSYELEFPLSMIGTMQTKAARSSTGEAAAG